MFINKLDGQSLSPVEFADYVFKEAQRQFNECHDDEKWDDLSEAEKVVLVCEQIDHQLNDRDWVKSAVFSLDDKICSANAMSEETFDECSVLLPEQHSKKGNIDR